MGIRKGDQVVVICGKDKGKKGKVIAVSEKDDRNFVTVDGVNVVIKHKKARNAKEKSAREKKASPIDVSNVMILCKCGKATRIAHKINDKGVKNRVCVKCGEVLDKKFVKAKEKAKEVEAEATDKAAEEKTEAKKPIVRREVKATADSKVKSQTTASVKSAPRKIGGA
jgi:large subunit ribosomal protein L24